MSVHFNKARKYQYYFRGGRTYVQGKDIFSSFCDLLYEEGIHKFFVKEIRFPQMLHSNGMAIRFNSREEFERLDVTQINAFMSIVFDENEMFVCLFEDKGSPIKLRKEERENENTCIKKINYTANFESINHLNGVNSFPVLLSAMVDGNKNVHVHTLGDIEKTYEYHWTYLKNFYVDLFLKFPEEIIIRIKNLGIKKNERQEGYTLNRLFFTLSDREYRTDMCYRFIKRGEY
jgi:hypothetical protein